MHDFEFLCDLFPDAKVVSFNLFFHGFSEMREDHLNHAELKAILGQILLEENIQNYISVGYSLGGKFALNLVNYFPEQTKQVLLIAPEGIKANNFYNFSSRIWLARKIFKSTIKNPSWFFALGKFLRNIKVVSSSLVRFMELQMEKKIDREMAYNTWAKFRFIFPNQKRLKENLQKNQIDLVVLIGAKDRIISPATGVNFIAEMELGTFRLLPITHDVFRSDYLEIIKKEFKEIVR